ncbi:MAG: phospholipid carrier-dependent glycosyltransferase [Steroidobacteraceae bacterium]
MHSKYTARRLHLMTLVSHTAVAPVRSRLEWVAWTGAILALVCWFVLLGARPLFRPDEGRYAEIPREMLASGDWLVPRLNGLTYIEKPPLQYWLTAGGYKLCGMDTWCARLVPGLSAALGIALVMFAAWRLWGAGRGRNAGIICASAPLYFLIGQQLTLDMLFTLFLTAAVVAFCVAQSVREDPGARRRWLMLCWAAIAAGVMTKGLAALAIPALVLIVYSIWQRDARVWNVRDLALGSLLCLALSAPWFIAIGRAVPGFTTFFFIHEHFLRYATMSAQRFEPWWYFGPIVLIGIAPWIPQIVAAWRAQASEAMPRSTFDARRLLWVYAVVVFIFFSISKSKLAPYVLPVVPVLALLVASYRGVLDAKPLRWSSAITAAAALLVALALVVFARVAHKEKQYVLLELMRPGALAMALALAAASLAAFGFLRWRRNDAAFIAIAVGWFGAGALLIGWAASAAGPLYSSEALARRLDEQPRPPGHIYNIGYYEQTLPFYLGRTVDIVDYQGELAFGLSEEPWRALSMDDFAKRWRAEPDAFAIVESDNLEHLSTLVPIEVIARDPRYALVRRP